VAGAAAILAVAGFYRLGIADSDLPAQATVDRAPRYFLQETPYGAQFAARRTADNGNYYWRITQWMLPFFQVIPAEPGARYLPHAAGSEKPS
jgi:hypothetical protein